MKLKDYQIDVLDQLSVYLARLAEKRTEAEEFVEFQKTKGRDATVGDYCRDAWESLSDQLPQVTRQDGTIVSPAYVSRTDGVGRPIPNICLKVPTGGGKTLLASVALDRINTEYFRQQTGLVLWIVPSEAIYSQTWRALANREHPYRQMLERASGGRVKMLEKSDAFHATDVDNQLCVMLMMLQAGAVKAKSKEARKMFQDSGKYPSFFPDVDDELSNEALRELVPNMDLTDLLDEGYGLMPKHSLGNVLRLTRPLVIIDEGHKAYSDTALNTICDYNPRFILELSATPNAREHISNVVVNVSGGDLKNEQMIKLPINIVNDGGADWKHALAASKQKLDELQKAAHKVQNNENRYIRPILLVRVERTGKDQRDKHAVHAEDVREYLIEKLGASADEIKVKSSEMDELADVEKVPEYKGQGLLSDFCPVRYVITKDALREGWDCPFAYILAALSRTTAATAITQMVGRVLRQPGAQWTGVDALNECYVYTHDTDVQKAVDNVRKGLQEEGMGDLADGIRVQGASQAGSRRKTIERRKAFKGLKIFMPRVLSKHYRTGQWRQFDYERDLLPRLGWESLSFRGVDQFVVDDRDKIDRTRVRVDVEDLAATGPVPALQEVSEHSDLQIDIAAMVRLLLDAIPNPWQGARIFNDAIAKLRKRGISDARLFTNRLALVDAIKKDLKSQLRELGEAEFRRMLADDELSFQLVSQGDPDLNWELAETLYLDVSDDDKVQSRKNGTPLEKSLFDPVYQKEINTLEKEVAWYLDADLAVSWWHRISVKQDWHVQGWQRNRIYPDFLVCVKGEGNGMIRFRVLETKGMHLIGNEDTQYKERLFELLSEHSATNDSVGELLLKHGKQQLRFDMLLEDNWRTNLKLEEMTG